MEMGTGARSGTRIERRGEERVSPGTDVVVVEVGRKTRERGDDANEEPEATAPRPDVPAKPAHHMRRTRA